MGGVISDAKYALSPNGTEIATTPHGDFKGWSSIYTLEALGRDGLVL